MKYTDGSWEFSFNEMVSIATKAVRNSVETAKFSRFERLIDLWYSMIRTFVFEHKCVNKTADETLQRFLSEEKYKTAFWNKQKWTSEQVENIIRFKKYKDNNYDEAFYPIEKEEPPQEEPPQDEPPQDEPPQDEPPQDEPPQDEPPQEQTKPKAKQTKAKGDANGESGKK